MGACIDLMRIECTTDSSTVAHERLASTAQFFCTMLKSRVFVRDSGMQGLVQIHLGAGNTHTCQKGYSDRVNKGSRNVKADNAPHMVLYL